MNAVSDAWLRAGAAAGLRVRGLVKTYGDRNGAVTAVDGLDLDARPGDFLCILGPSGCGKSSLLNILAGFEQATAGEASIDGETIQGPAHGQGVVFQDTAALFPWLTVRGNIAFGLSRRGLTRAQVADKVGHALALVGLEGFGDKWPHQLSGGMRQLVSIARVLVTDSRVLLMDEPFAALDALTRQSMQRKLLEIWRATGKTIVLITHSVDEAIYLGTRVLVFTPRPARVATTLDIDLPHPRQVTAPRFNEFKSAALAHLGF
jgi:NitT/TauT family transport system ATP-binding protein